MQFYNIIAGIVLLVVGRKLFWLCVGLAGFLFGMEITPLFVSDKLQWMQLAIAVGMGIAGAVLAILAQRIAFTFGGFFTGMFLALRAAQSFGLNDVNTLLILAIGAGVIGAVFALLIMDKAITILACLVGAWAIVGELHFGQTMNTVVFVVLTGAGFIIQEQLFPGAKKEED